MVGQPQVYPTYWNGHHLAEFPATFRARFIPQGIMDKKKREFRNLTLGNKSVDAYQREFWTCHVMLKKTFQLMLVSKRSFVMDFTLISS